MSEKALHPDMRAIMQVSEKITEQLGPRGGKPEEDRQWWTLYTEALSQPCPEEMEVFDLAIPTEESDVPVRVYRSERGVDPRPVILYMHGGGFMLGDLDSSDSIAWGFAQETGAVVLSVDYRLTPEHPYPAAFNDCYGVLTWIADNSDELGVDAGRIAVAGDSAGGNLSAAVSLAARDRGGPRIAAQALIYPVTGLNEDAPSYVENADGSGLTTERMKKYRDLYLPGRRDTNDPYARPIIATDHSGLPPAWIHTAEIDPIRDDGRVYASKLALAGTWVTYREARGMIHGFMRARFSGPGARAEYDAICSFLREHLA